MSVYTNPPEWEAQGKKPPSSKRTEGWKPGDRVPASWLNWFWFSTVNSLREIAQAFVNHRDASAPHDGHETKEGATAKVEAHSQKITAVHGVGQQYVAKTSRSDQWPSWNDIPDKPSTFPVDVATLPQASTSQAGIVQLTNSRSSTSETLAVTAKALNDHRNSADHDGRYYTKAQIDELIGQGVMLVVPSDDILVESLSEEVIYITSRYSGNLSRKSFTVWATGRYRVTLEATRSSVGSGHGAYVFLQSGDERIASGYISDYPEPFKTISITTPVLLPGTTIRIGAYISNYNDGSVTIRNVRLRGRLQSVPIAE